MKKRTFICLLVFSILLTTLCSGCGKKDRLTNPPGHKDFEAVIGKTLPDAAKILDVSESDLIRDEYLIDVYHTGKTVEFAGVEFDVCLGMYVEEEVVNSVYYLKNFDNDISGFAEDVTNVAKKLEHDISRESGYITKDDTLTKNIPLTELEEAYSAPEGHQVSDMFDITEEAPKNVQDHMEFMMSTDYWKAQHYLGEDIPLPAGYLCQFLASCIPDNNRASMFIRYYVNRRPGSYSYMVVED